MFSFAGKTLEKPLTACVMEETPKKIAESTTKCFICSSIPLSKNKVYIFGKTSADLAGIIRLSLEIDVNKYSEDSKLFVCRQCFQQLTKYERAAKKLQEIRQELLSTFRNREQLREKRLAREENRDNLETNVGDVQVSVSKCLRFSETSHVNSAACTSYPTPLAQSTPVPSGRQAFLVPGVSPIVTKDSAGFESVVGQGDSEGDLRHVSKDFPMWTPGCSDRTSVKLQVHYPSKNVNKTLVGSFQSVGKALAHGVPSQIAKAVMNCPTVRTHVVASVIKTVSKEVAGLCAKSKPSLLRRTSKDDLQNFAFEKLCEEWQERAPIFYAFLLNTAISRTTTKGTWFGSIALAGLLLLKQRNREMGATAAVMGFLLKSKSAEVNLILQLYSVYSLFIRSGPEVDSKGY